MPSGCLKILDTETCSQAYSLSDLGTVDSVSISSNGASQLTVGVASHNTTHVAVYPSLSVLEAGEGSHWQRTHIPLGDTSTQVRSTSEPESGHDDQDVLIHLQDILINSSHPCIF